MAEREEILAELEALIQRREESTKKYQQRKKEVVDFDVRSAYEILQLSSEGDETRLRKLRKKL